MKAETIVLNAERNVTLTAYVQDAGDGSPYATRRPAVLVLPGGGYTFCSDWEADPVAMAYLTHGFHAFVLRYSVGRHKTWPNPLEDLEQAMALIRERSGVWNLYGDKVAVAGFSAGGHLAACAAATAVNRPNAAIIGYGVTLGEDIRSCNDTAPDVVSAVSRDTCPCFVFSSRRDPVVPIANTTRFIHALAEHDVAMEAHIYAYGPHGFSTADSSITPVTAEMCGRIPHWVPDSVRWLRDVLGDFTPGGMTAPRFRLHMHDDPEDFFSVCCTAGYLLRCPQTRGLVSPLLDRLRAEASRDEIMDPQMLPGIFERAALRDILTARGVSEDAIARLDAALRAVPKARRADD